MPHLYIHIPFCHKACHYCNFHFSTNLKLKSDFVSALIKEIEDTKDFLSKDKTLKTIYFGGGTPSILSVEELQTIFSAIEKVYDLSKLEEVTLEMNPEDALADYLSDIKRYTPIDRLSLGMQAFSEEDLAWMNRNHSLKESFAALENMEKTGFDNYSIDMIYGYSGLADNVWEHTLRQITEREVPHISAYALTVEPKTYFAYMQNKKQNTIVDDHKAAGQMQILNSILMSAGYNRYEISNSALAGKRAIHNSAYWKGSPYLGLGPSAHSYDGKHTRYFTIANNALYIAGVTNNLPIRIPEILTDKEQHNEYVMIKLRTSEGIDLNEMTEKIGEKTVKRLISKAKIANPKWVQMNDHSICFTLEGWLWTDSLLVDLFL